MKDSGALKPELFPIPSLIERDRADKSGASDEEKQLSFMAQSGGWRVFKDFTMQLLKELDGGTDAAMAQGLPFEEIGRNAVVINLAKGIITKQLQKVEDAEDSCKQSDGTDK